MNVIAFQCPCGAFSMRRWTAWRPSSQPRHAALGPGLIDEDHVSGVALLLAGTPVGASLGHVDHIL
ncbi:MAG: hypothetical protein IPJ41_12485 [Phycisphaerales bacterium]|nr:hypothetical protein [Phycisphaerales bacterium]